MRLSVFSADSARRPRTQSRLVTWLTWTLVALVLLVIVEVVALGA